MSLIVALCGSVSKKRMKQSSETVPLTGSLYLKGILKGNRVYTWMGDTAAAGAVRTGIPLSGLLEEECI